MNAPDFSNFRDLNDLADKIKLHTEECARQKRIASIIQEQEFPRTVSKAWGEELHIAYNKNYCFKRIKINAGHKTSLQYHETKHETNYLVLGRAMYHWIDSTGTLHTKPVEEGFFVTLAPGEIHRFEAITDIVLFEASTPEIWDVVRLEDSYGRQGTSAP